MNSSTLHQLTRIKQDAKVGKYTMKGFALTNLLHNLIREHGDYRHAECSLNVNALSISDKQLLLGYFESAEWLEYARKSPTNTEALFSECADHIQELVDQECIEVYQEYTEEMRAYK